METEVHVEMEVHGRGRMEVREVVLLIFSESKSVVVFNQFCFVSVVYPFVWSSVCR